MYGVMLVIAISFFGAVIVYAIKKIAESESLKYERKNNLRIGKSSWLEK